MEPITLTVKAAERVKDFLNRRGYGLGLRLAVKKTGCSGFAYVISFAEAIEEKDEVFCSNGIKVVVDGKSLPYVNGTEIDFCKNGLGDSFTFKNPNAVGECGCGESFAV